MKEPFEKRHVNLNKLRNFLSNTASADLIRKFEAELVIGFFDCVEVDAQSPPVAQMEKCVYCTYPRSFHADGEWENHQLGTRTVETDWESRAIKAERRVEILMKALEESQDLINESILALKEAHDEKV
jgi:hypothetical protein